MLERSKDHDRPDPASSVGPVNPVPEKGLRYFHPVRPYGVSACAPPEKRRSFRGPFPDPAPGPGRSRRIALARASDDREGMALCPRHPAGRTRFGPFRRRPRWTDKGYSLSLR